MQTENSNTFLCIVVHTHNSRELIRHWFMSLCSQFTIQGGLLTFCDWILVRLERSERVQIPTGPLRNPKKRPHHIFAIVSLLLGYNAEMVSAECPRYHPVGGSSRGVNYPAIIVWDPLSIPHLVTTARSSEISKGATDVTDAEVEFWNQGDGRPEVREEPAELVWQVRKSGQKRNIHTCFKSSCTFEKCSWCLNYSSGLRQVWRLKNSYTSFL